MQDVANVAKRSGFDHIKQAAHPGLQSPCLGNTLCCSISALCGVLGSSALSHIDDSTRKKSVTRTIEVNDRRKLCKGRNHCRMEMGFGEIETQSRLLDRHPFDTTVILFKQYLKGLYGYALNGGPISSSHICSLDRRISALVISVVGH